MDKELLSFKKVNPNKDLIDEIWNFNVKNLNSTPESTISKYIVALGQWLIYYRFQTNETKAEISKLQIDLEFLVSGWMSDKILKEYKTKTAAREYLIRGNVDSSLMQDKVTQFKNDLMRVDGVDKAVTELIAAFKRELTRRSDELYTLRKERYAN